MKRIVTTLFLILALLSPVALSAPPAHADKGGKGRGRGGPDPAPSPKPGPRDDGDGD